jgi:phosphomannomutase
MSPKHPIKFGTDGWRAIMAEDFTFANVSLVVRAIISHLSQQNGGQLPNKPVLLGYDGRFLGKEFALHAGAVLAEAGLKPMIVDKPTPTPIVAFTAKHLDTCGALMFTASHNPPAYMGIKFIPPYAGPATQDITDSIIANVDKLAEDPQSFNKPALAHIEAIDPTADYEAFLANSLDLTVLANANLKVAYDPMYGVGLGALDKLIREKTQCQLTVLHDRLDPHFGGQLPEPNEAHLPELKALMSQGNHDLAIANDGDADRFGVFDEQGNFMGANQILPMVLRYLHNERGFRGSAVRSVATSRMLDAVGAALNVTVHEVKVGFKHMGAVMRQEPVIVGGEEAGGLSIQTHIPEKDGILACLLFIEMVTAYGKPISQIWTDTQAEAGLVLHGLHKNLHLSDEAKIQMMADFKGMKAGDTFAGRTIDSITTLEGVKLWFGEWDWVLIRPSGTEPILRVYGESTDATFTEAMLNDLTQRINTLMVAHA